MSYNVYVDRNRVGEEEFWAYAVEGNGVNFHRVFKVKPPENTRLAYLEYCQQAFTELAQAMAYGAVPRQDVVFQTTHKVAAGYLCYFIQQYQGMKPLPQYFNAAYNAYMALESLGCTYGVNVASWANKARLLSTQANFDSQQHSAAKEKAIDAFKGR